MKTNIRKIKSTISALAKLACGSRALRLHPKFRWLSFVCPIIRRSQSFPCSSPSSKFPVTPPHGPPRLHLRKRRLSVRPNSQS